MVAYSGTQIDGSQVTGSIEVPEKDISYFIVGQEYAIVFVPTINYPSQKGETK